MKFPEARLEVRAECRVYPSEDPVRVITAVKNVITNSEPLAIDNKVVATAKDATALRKIYEQARSRQVTGVLERMLLYNMVAGSTWFYLNKQAAYGGIVSLCEEEVESPLGPIKVTIRSSELESVIDWLVPSRR